MSDVITCWVRGPGIEEATLSTVSFQSRRNKKLGGEAEGDDVDALVGVSGELEEALAALWTSVLKVESVSVDDNFFEVGGTSLHAMLIASRVEEQLDAEMSLVDFFDSPTFAGLCHSVTTVDAGD